MIPKKSDKLNDKSLIQNNFFSSKLSFDKSKLIDKSLVQKIPENIDLGKRSFIKKSVLGLAGLGGVALFSKYAKAGIFFSDDSFQSAAVVKTVTAEKTASYTAVAGDYVPCDTTSTAFTVTLPASPSSGDEVFVFDTSTSWATNNLTVGGNGNNINGAATFLNDVDDGGATFCYVGSEWRVHNPFGVS